MQAPDTLAEEYEIFEETVKKVTLETEEGDMLFAVAYEAGEEGRPGPRKTKTVCRTSWSSPVRVLSCHRLQGVYKLLGPARCSVR